MIATLRQTTTRTRVPTLRERFGYPLAANTGLTRVAGVNLDELAPGAFSLVREFTQEVSPSSIVDGLRQHSACKALDIQIFDSNHAVAVDQYSRDFMLEVGPLVLNVRVLLLQGCNSFSAPVRPFVFASCHGALRHAQPALGVTAQARIVNLGAITQGHECCQAHINPNRCRRYR